MILDHLVFTRFSCRDAFAHVGRRRDEVDPLSPAFMQVRLALIDMVSLPSILSQTNQRFAWIILVDRDLPHSWRSRVERIASLRDRTHVVEFPAVASVPETKWIERIVLPDTDYLTTTILDDDDSLPAGYLDYVRRSLLTDCEVDRLGPARIVAASRIIQWELTFSPSARYGYRCPWHRRRTQASSCGFSLVCKFPEISLSVLGLKHALAFNYLSFDQPPAHRLISEFRQALLAQCDASGLRLATDSPGRLNVDMSAFAGPVLMTNHTQNAESARLSETKDEYETVEGPGTFEGFAIDWQKVDEYSWLFQQGRGK
jgi:hypothetical protein